MSCIDEEPVVKKSKTDDSRCCKCNVHLRKEKSQVTKIIKTREEACNFYETHGIFIQVGDILCGKCYAKIRASTSKKSRNSIAVSCTTKPEEPSLIQQEDDIIPSQSFSEIFLENDNNEIHTQSSSQSSTIISTQTTETESKYSLYYPTDDSCKEETEKIILPFERVSISKRLCFICGSQSKQDIVDVPLDARIQVFSSRRLFIPKRNRCCLNHLIKKRFYNDEVSKMTVSSKESSIEVSKVKLFLDKLSEKSDMTLHDKIGDCAISDERLLALTGYSWENVLKIKNMLNTMRESSNRNLEQALIIFLIKLKSGNSNNLIAAILNITEKIVEYSIKSILGCFQKHILPSNFGVHVRSREFYEQEQSKATKLFDFHRTLFIICDGTYLRHEKSANNFYQRKSYSGQKKTPLCKPFTMCTTNGYIVDLAGPFEGKLNDAQILELILKDPNGLTSILKPGDVFILDRGFRDIKKSLEEKGFVVLMPA